MEMPSVSRCDATECAYNMGGKCHALAITVGDEPHPRCDTFCDMSTTGGDPSTEACVGACKMMSCMYNESLECEAPDVCIGHKGSDVDCLTYEMQ